MIEQQCYIDALGIFVDVNKTHLKTPSLAEAKRYAQSRGKRLLTHHEWAVIAQAAELYFPELLKDMTSGCAEATDSVVIFPGTAVTFKPHYGVEAEPVLVEEAEISRKNGRYVIHKGTREPIWLPDRSGYIGAMDHLILLPFALSDSPQEAFYDAFCFVTPSGIRVIRHGVQGKLRQSQSRVYDIDLTAPPEELFETAYRFCALNAEDLPPPEEGSDGKGADWDLELRELLRRSPWKPESATFF